MYCSDILKLQPYVCDRCNKACSSSTYLKKHKKNCHQDVQHAATQDGYIEIPTIPTTHEDPDNIPENSIMLTEVAENSETYFVRLDGNQLIHEIINPAINEHNLVNLNDTGDVEILNDMIPVVQNELSDNIRMHIDDKHIFHTIDPNCMRIQVDHIDDESANIENQQYFITSDCVVNK